MLRWPRAVPVCALIVAVLAGGCGDPPSKPRIPPAPAHLDIVSGDNQTAVVGTALAAPVVVQVTDSGGAPIKAQLVNFRVTSGGGSAFAGSALTDANGVAQERWTLGTSTSEPQRLEARAVDATTGAPLVFGSFHATALPGPPERLVALDSTTRVGDLGGTLSPALAVQVTDHNLNGVPGVRVDWQITAGTGSLNPSSATTDSTGRATSTWTLGAHYDTLQAVAATAQGLAPVAVLARARVPLDARITKFGPDSATAQGGGALDSIALTVTLAGGAPLSALPVTWAVTDGGGTLEHASSATGPDGRTSNRWTLGSRGGLNRVTATPAGLAPVTFTMLSLAPVARLELSPAALGMTVGSSAQITAALFDSAGNALSGRPITWLSSAPAVAPVSGTGQVTAAALGTATISATAQGVSGSTTVTVGVPQIATSAGAVAFRSAEADPPGQSVYITNGGVGPLDQLTDSVAYGAGEPTGWLIAALSGSTAPARLDLNAHVAALAVGHYTATVRIYSPSAANSPLTIAVALDLTGTPAYVNVTPQSPRVVVGGSTVQLSAEVRNRYGTTLPYTFPLIWRSEDTLRATVSQTGLVTSRGQIGRNNIWAFIYDSTGEALAQGGTAVYVVTPIVHITVTPATDTLLVGDSLRFTATATDSSGNVVTIYPLTWSVYPSAPSASISSSGVFLPAWSGTYTITATAPDSTSGSATVVVKYPPVYIDTVIVPAVVGDQATASARIRSNTQITRATASSPTRSVDLAYDGSTQLWTGNLPLDDLPQGPVTITVKAASAAGDSASRSKTTMRDLPPSVSITAPLDYAVAHSTTIHLAGSCTDPGHTACTTITASWKELANPAAGWYTGGDQLAAGVDHIDTSADLPPWDGQYGIFFVGKDSAGQTAQAKVDVFLEQTPHLVDVVSAPGSILDANPGDRVLWGGLTGGKYYVRDLVNGTDQLVNGPDTVYSAMLVPGGVLFTAYPNGVGVYEWRAGSLTTIAGASVSLAGRYGLYNLHANIWAPQMMWRDYQADVTTVLPDTGGGVVGPDGSVVYRKMRNKQLYRWSGGTSTRISPDSTHAYSGAAWDGQNVIAVEYSGLDETTTGTQKRLILLTGGATVELIPWTSDYIRAYGVANGWAAWEQVVGGFIHVFTRSPTGTIAQAGFTGSGEALLPDFNGRSGSIGPNGQLVLRTSPNGSVRYALTSAPPYSSAVTDVGHAGMRFWDGDAWVVLGRMLMKVQP